MQLEHLSLRALLTGEPNRLRNIIRFSNCHRVRNENVAEHSYYTILYAFMIGAWLQGRGNDVDVGLLLSKAVVHDLEEARSGDFPRPFKYSSPEIKAALDVAAVVAFDQVVRPSVSTQDVADLKELWANSKDETLEGRIVAFADYLSVVGYLWLEVQGSNLTMRQHVIDMEKYAREFDAPAFDPIRPLVQEAAQLIKEFLHGLER